MYFQEMQSEIWYQLTLKWPLLFVQTEGKWITISIADDNVDIIEQGGPPRLYARKLACTEACKELEVTFYIK